MRAELVGWAPSPAEVRALVQLFELEQDRLDVALAAAPGLSTEGRAQVATLFFSERARRRIVEGDVR